MLKNLGGAVTLILLEQKWLLTIEYCYVELLVSILSAPTCLWHFLTPILLGIK